MSIFNRIIGTEHHEPAFRVEFNDGEKGLHRVVDLALGGETGDYILGKAQAHYPLSSVEVTLRIGENEMRRFNAHLQRKQRSYKRLNFSSKPLQTAGFHVLAEDNYAHIRSTKLVGRLSPSLTNVPGIISYSAMPESAEIKYGLEPRGLRLGNVESSVSEYAMALEIIVNSIVGPLRKGTSPQVLTLDAGERISRIVPEAERLNYQFKKRLQGK